MFRVSGIGEDITLTISQFRTRGNIIAVVDRTYSAVIRTTNGKIAICDWACENQPCEHKKSPIFSVFAVS